jgi:predicted flap endonuclease-1-like 5' DNA nuclease
MNIPCILIPVIVGLICAILGYLLGRMFAKNSSETSSLVNELDACLEKSTQYVKTIATLEAELAAAKKTTAQSFLGEITASIPFDTVAAMKVFGKKIKENDLKIVEGIGPKIEELCRQSGITTWQLLSETATEKLQTILNEGGERFLMHNPGTWARQAALAYQGKWQELKDWQDVLDGGKE